MTGRYRVGIDIGGTFTDFVLLDHEKRRITVGKRLTTPADYLVAVFDGLDSLLRSAGLAYSDVAGVVHGTTLVTNTLIERKGARTALVVTEGMRDQLEIGTELRYDIYDLGILRPEPIVPRYLRSEVKERLGPDGSILVGLDLEALPDVVDGFRREGVTSVAVCLLHSYANPVHEQAIGRALRDLFPESSITLSSELTPEIREYERASTATANAYVKPLVSRYLAQMEERLEAKALGGPLNLMLSNGGLAAVSEALAAPIQLIESGPAGGVMAASFFAEAAGSTDLISFDMGGTTAKTCLIDGGLPTRSHSFEAARVHRFKKGSGLPLRVPVIEMLEIGAGGGSIARVDSLGLLKVGPDSAGSDPGPACYGLGGDRPTVTDADLVLGYLNPEYFLGGSMALDRAAAESAIAANIGSPLGLDVVAAASGIQEIVNESMATSTRLHVAERGRDLRRYTLLAFGGAGPVHAYRLAELLGVKRLICPYAAGAASALGFLVAPLQVEHSRSYVTPLDAVNWRHLRRLFGDMEAEARATLNRLGVSTTEILYQRTVDMRFSGQGYEIEVPISAGTLGPESVPVIGGDFLKAYTSLFERSPEGVSAEALTWRLRATAPKPDVRLDVESGSLGDPRKGERAVYFQAARGYVETPVYDRYNLSPGTKLTGPAVIEERESTVVIGPSADLVVDASLNILVTLP